MFSQIVTTYKESAIYSLGNLSNKVVGFILLPLYTSYITVADFGILGLIEPLTQIFFTLLGLGLNSAYMRWYSIEKDTIGKGTIFFNINIVLFLNTIICVSILILFSGDISRLLFSTGEFESILQIAFANIFFLVVNPIIFSTLRIQHKAARFSVVRIVQFTINLLLNIVFIVYFEWGLLSIFLSQLISQVLVFLYFIPMYIRLTTFQVNLKLIREFLIFSLPLVPVGFFQLINTMINRYFLEHYDTLESVGLFSFAYRISNTVKILIIESLTLSLTPILYQKLASKEGKRFVQKNYLYAIYITVFVYILIASFSREIIMLIAQNEDYYSSYKLIPILTFAYVFQAMVYFYHVLLSYSKKTTRILNATILTAVITVGLNFLLIPEFRIYGAAAISILSSLTLFLIMSFYARDDWKAFFETRKVVLIIFCGLFIVLINQFLPGQSGLIYLAVKFFICLSFPFLLYPFNFYEQVELERISYSITVLMKKILRK